MTAAVPWGRLLLVWLAVAVVFFTEVVGSLADARVPSWAASYTVMHTAVGLCYAVCAWVAWRSADSPVPGRVMIAVAFLWLPPTFISATQQIGWLWPVLDGLELVWAVLVGAIVLIYPAGKLHGPVDVGIAVAASIGVSIRFVCALLFNQPVDGSRNVALNPYAIVDGDEIFVFVDRAFRLFGVALILLIVVVVAGRWLRGSTPARHIAFVMPVALVLWAAAIAYETLVYSLGSTVLEVLGYISLAATAAVPIGFVAGLSYLLGLRGRVSDLMVITRDGVDRTLWQAILADTLRDPSLRVYWWEESDSRYVDSHGRAATPSAGPDGLGEHRQGALLPINTPDGPLAVIRHDRALSENSKLLAAVSTALRLSVDNTRLRDELEATLREVRESRLRIVDAGVEARRQIERDLHDGSQQSLVALALRLRMASGRAEQLGQHDIADDLDAALGQLSAALKQLRELARGIHPTSLTVGGLATAVPELVAHSPVPIETSLVIESRPPAVVEATVYFFVSECLTNIAKYAEARSGRVAVTASASELVIEVADDGRGGASLGEGSGLLGLIDRVEALGGRVELQSVPEHGTTVMAWIPLAGAPEAR
ncbi:sensor histidine kinase [Microterricola viridarii]|uniref:histidine kinase n=1 Tax=Microterricola viridarii TaxID=412690 RepID=A0A1H1QGV8_9MICO|nr:ATP-binding protein [Microterricola viridarii]SDS22690.1 Histidine kinase-, DNA gyrase B-, and HSP90-like ATPase [Microterricola viridarii]